MQVVAPRTHIIALRGRPHCHTFQSHCHTFRCHCSHVSIPLPHVPMPLSSRFRSHCHSFRSQCSHVSIQLPLVFHQGSNSSTSSRAVFDSSNRAPTRSPPSDGRTRATLIRNATPPISR